MLAVKLLGKCRAEVREVERPQLRPGWVVVRMRACGICGSDLHGLYEPERPAAHISGHECMGEVVEVGTESHLPVGARVFVYAIIGCWNCEYCRSGQIHLCSRAQTLGKWTPDVGHLAKARMDPLAMIREHWTLVNHFHFKDMSAPGDWAHLLTSTAANALCIGAAGR